MPAVVTGRELVGMAAMSLIDPVPSEQAPQEGPGGIDDEDPQQNDPAPEQLGRHHGQHRNQIDYILCSQRWRSSIQSAKTRPGADCGSDHEHLIAKLKK